SRSRRKRRAGGGRAVASAEAILARQSAARCGADSRRSDRRETVGAGDPGHGGSANEEPAKIGAAKRQKNGGVRGASAGMFVAGRVRVRTGEMRPVAQQGFYGQRQAFGGLRLQKISVDAGLLNLGDQRGGVMHGEDQNLG